MKSSALLETGMRHEIYHRTALSQAVSRCLLGALCIALSNFAQASPSTAQAKARNLDTQGWSTYRSPSYGFSFTFPDGLFKLDQSSVQANGGGIWLTDDRRARLIATSGPNTSSDTISAYRQTILTESYTGARLDYAPILPNGFVLSGVMPSAQGERMFYERVTFACDGRFIYGWQMMYPAGQRQKFDRIVEAVSRSYKPGRGSKGDCSE
jgi:hypothetical protein